MSKHLCKGDIDRTDPAATLGRLALSTQGDHEKAIAWLERDIVRTEAAIQPEKVKAKNISSHNAAIAWLRYDQRKLEK